MRPPFIAANIIMSQGTEGEGNPSVSEEDVDRIRSRYARSTKERIWTKVKPVQKNDCRSNKTQDRQTWPMSNLAAIYATRVSVAPRKLSKECNSGEPDE